MNIDTGELRRMASSLTEEEKNEIFKAFLPVPEELKEEANKELAGKDRTFVNLKGKSPLANWANGLRQGRNNKCACGSGKKYKNCCGKPINYVHCEKCGRYIPKGGKMCRKCGEVEG